jgi:NAD/NADP transhydrogenase beta subunit
MSPIQTSARDPCKKDATNPAARHNEGGPICGMPVLGVAKARNDMLTGADERGVEIKLAGQKIRVHIEKA